MRGRLLDVGRTHAPFAAVLAVAAVVRAGFALAYRPGLFFTDSWAYLNMALSRFPVDIAADRPSGYPLVLRILSLNGEAVSAVVVVQHLSGLAVGVLVYALLLRLGTPRLLATLAAGLVLLDGYTIALEQHLMADPLSVLAAMGSVYLLATGPRSAAALATSGLLLAAAVTMRTGWVFCVPIWLVYLVWAHRGRATLVAAAAGLLLPLLAYGAGHAAIGRGFGMTQAEGWFLYGRVAGLADCGAMDVPAGTAGLCKPGPKSNPGFYVWSPDSPANRLFGGVGSGDANRSNELLRRYALAVIRERPGAYADLLLDDLARQAGTWDAKDYSLTVPGQRAPLITAYGRDVRDRYLPDYRERARWPAGAIRAYHDAARVPGWLAAGAAAIALLGILAGLTRWGRGVRKAEVALLLATGLALPIASTATVAANYRYVVTAFPFLLAAGALALGGLLQRGGVAAPVSKTSPKHLC